MKRVLAPMGLSALLACRAMAGPDVIIRERAKQLRDQNNARQVETPPTPPPATPATAKPATPPPAPAAQAVILTPQQANLARLQADLAGFKTNSTVTAEQQQRLANNLSAVAQGPNKPSPQATSKLAADLALALPRKTLTPGERSRLLQNLNAVLNGAAIPKSQMEDIVSDIQKIFKGSDQALVVANDAKVIAAEIQKTTAK